jgi:hypothetical protein
MHTGRLPSLRTRQRGSTILAALGVLALTALVVGMALSEARHRYLTSHQSSCWAQASPAAEAGVEMALMSAQGNSWTANGWTAAPGAPGTAAVTKSFPLSAGVTATGTISADVSVDKVTLSGKDWLRIRSTGRVNLSGGAVSGVDSTDVLLRKLSLRKDRLTGASMGTPQATRTIEILAEPLTTSLFTRPLLMQKKFTVSGGWVDSFDSEDPTKSTGGLYDVTKRQSNGDVAIINTQGTSDLGDTPVYGDLAYGTGAAPTGTTGVKGTITTPFTETVQPVAAPTWTTFNATPTVISTSVTLTGSTQASPAKYKVSSLTVSNGKVLTLAPHATGAESYLEVWVTGDFKTSGSGYILQKTGVHVTYHIAGDVTVSGSSFNNQSNKAANNIINVISVGASSSQKVTVSGSGTFIGVINAPAADFKISDSVSMSGAIIGKTTKITGGVNVHYDEALSRMSGGGSGGGYRVGSFVEAVR